jgi:hypothetical protein
MQKYQADEQAKLNQYNSLVDKYKQSVLEKQQDLTNDNNALTAQGLVPMTSEDDLASVKIRQLGELYKNAADDAARQKYNQEALQIAKDAGLVPQDYTGSVNGYATLSAAGTPSYERQAGEAKAAAEGQQQDFENQLALDKYNLDALQTNYNVNKPYYNPNSGSGSGGKPTQNDYLSAILSASGDYKSPANYLADLNKYKSQIVQYVGLSNYNSLVQSAQDDIDNGVTNKNYVKGTASPLRSMFSANFSQPRSGNSGNVSSWIDSAVKAAGVGEDWAQPLSWIIQHESSGNPQAINKSSGAYGLMQFLPQTWGNYGYSKTSDPVKQIEAGINYIKARYGTAARAKAFWQKNGWY